MARVRSKANCYVSDFIFFLNEMNQKDSPPINPANIPEIGRTIFSLLIKNFKNSMKFANAMVRNDTGSGLEMTRGQVSTLHIVIFFSILSTCRLRRRLVFISFKNREQDWATAESPMPNRSPITARLTVVCLRHRKI